MFGKPSSRKLNSFFEALSRSHAIIEFNIDGTIERANENFCRALGYTPAEIVGKHHSMFCPTDYAASEEYRAFWKALASGKYQSSSFKRIAKGGQEIWIQASYDPVIVGGKAVKVVKVATDITEAKQKAIEDDSKLAAISRSQAVIEFEPTGKIITANENFCAATGYGLLEIQGKHHSMFCDADYIASQEYKDFWPKLARGEFLSNEFLRYGKGGKPLWIQAAYNPILDDKGAVVKVVKFATDVTARMNDIARLSDGLNTVARGDLTVNFATPFVPTMEKTRSDFNEAVAKLRETLQTVGKAAGEIAAGSREIGANAGDLAKRTEHQAASLEETAAALAEITTASSESSQSADLAGKVVAQTKLHAEQSSKIVDGAVDAMAEIETSAKEINNIIAVIDSIAFQTNLLALNAGVEAARAGDAGKGFAVVAQEVRELAQRSAAAAKEIKGLITASGTHVEKGVGLVRQTGDALREILEAIRQIDGNVTDIVSSTREQGTSLTEVNTAVNQIDQATQQNAAMSEESTAASHRLSEEADILFELLSAFKLGTDASTPAMSSPTRAAPRAAAASVKRPVPAVSGNLALKENWEEF